MSFVFSEPTPRLAPYECRPSVRNDRMIASSEAQVERYLVFERTVYELFCQMCMPDPGPNPLLALDVRDMRNPEPSKLSTEDSLDEVWDKSRGKKWKVCGNCGNKPSNAWEIDHHHHPEKIVLIVTFFKLLIKTVIRITSVAANRRK